MNIALVPDLAAACDLDGNPLTTEDFGLACIDLYLGDGSVPDAFPFGSSTGYVGIPLTGSLTLHAVAFGDANQPANRLVSVEVILAPGDAKTVAIFGLRQSEVVTNVSDGELSDPTGGLTGVNTFHAEATLVPIGLDVEIDGILVADNLPYGLYRGPIEIGSGTGLSVVMDTDGDSLPDVIGSLDLSADEAYDLFVVVNPNPATPHLILQHTRSTRVPSIVPMTTVGSRARDVSLFGRRVPVTDVQPPFSTLASRLHSYPLLVAFVPKWPNLRGGVVPERHGK